jgi:uncharacterized protein (TIGR02145 family)
MKPLRFLTVILLCAVTGCEEFEGTPGLTSLIEVTLEPPGDHCAFGGLKIVTGLDDNSNDIIEADEIDQTNYVCNGESGFNSLIAITVESAGSNCVAGGYKIDVGQDNNRNNILDTSEITYSVYACNGADGNKSLITITDEPIGANCEAGGFKIQIGLDLNNNNILDANEVTSIRFVCHGKDGAIAEPGTYRDPRDGKVYKTIKIGNDTWLAENMNFDAGAGTYCYANNLTNCTAYGKLYTWNAAKIAVPPGWRMPTLSDYQNLINHFGSASGAYEALLPEGDSGFDAEFGGFLNHDGNFIYLGQYADFWTITPESGTDYVYILDLNTPSQTATLGADRKNRGFSLRCIKNSLQTEPPTSGLVAFYPFNNSANDESGNANNGQVNGGVSFVNDRYTEASSAAQFNGTNGYILVPNSSTLQTPGTAITLSGWIKLLGSQPVAAGLITKTNSTSYGQYHLNYQAWSTPNVYFGMNGLAGSGAATTLNTGVWYFIAVVYNGTTIKTYLNGAHIHSQAATGSMTADTLPLTIGLDTPGVTEYLNGLLDELRIYNVALNDQQMKSLYDHK